MRHTKVAALLGLLGLFLAPAAGATVLVAMDVEDLAAIAPVVVVGDVNQIEVDWNGEKTRIYTRVRITPVEVLKGPANLGTVTVKTIGGKVGDTVARLPGAPNFEIGERVLVFLEPRKDGDGYLTVGMYQGKFKVFRDPDTGADLLLRDGPELGVRIVEADTTRPVETVRTLKQVRRVVRRSGGAK